jgi:hypothetical protein
VPDIQNLNFDIGYIFHRYRSNQLRYRITSISEPDDIELECSTFDIEVSSISKVFCQLQYRSKYFDIEGCVFDIEATFDIEGFDIAATFDIGGASGKVPVAATDFKLSAEPEQHQRRSSSKFASRFRACPASLESGGDSQAQPEVPGHWQPEESGPPAARPESGRTRTPARVRVRPRASLHGGRAAPAGLAGRVRVTVTGWPLSRSPEPARARGLQSRRRVPPVSWRQGTEAATG